MDNATPNCVTESQNTVSDRPSAIHGHVTEPYFPRFLDLPLDVRLLVYESYLQDEPQCTSSHPYIPSIIHNPVYCPHHTPNLTLANHQIRNELWRFVLSASTLNLSGDAIPHFLAFLKTLPDDIGFGSIHRLDLPVEAWYHYYKRSGCMNWLGHHRIESSDSNSPGANPDTPTPPDLSPSPKPPLFRNDPLHLLTRCPNLHTLHLTFQISVQTGQRLKSGSQRWGRRRWIHRSANEIVDDYRLERIFVCRKLHTVDIVGVGYDFEDAFPGVRGRSKAKAKANVEGEVDVPCIEEAIQGAMGDLQRWMREGLRENGSENGDGSGNGSGSEQDVDVQISVRPGRPGDGDYRGRLV